MSSCQLLQGTTFIIWPGAEAVHVSIYKKQHIRHCCIDQMEWIVSVSVGYARFANTNRSLAQMLFCQIYRRWSLRLHSGNHKITTIHGYVQYLGLVSQSVPYKYCFLD